MNELWFDLGKSFIYYNTNAKDFKSALGEFVRMMESNGCNLDNFGWKAAELRDTDLNPIETVGLCSHYWDFSENRSDPMTERSIIKETFRRR